MEFSKTWTLCASSAFDEPQLVPFYGFFWVADCFGFSLESNFQSLLYDLTCWKCLRIVHLHQLQALCESRAITWEEYFKKLDAPGVLLPHLHKNGTGNDNC